MMNGQQIRHSRGVALIESMIAVVIFAIGMVALAQYQGTVLREGGLQKARDEATLLAQEKLEEIRNYSEADFLAFGNGADAATINGVNAVFTRSWTVNTSATLEYRSATVSVAWTGADGTAESVALTGLVVWRDAGKAAIASGGGTYNPLPNPSGGTELLPDVPAITNPDISYTTPQGPEILVDAVDPNDLTQGGESQLVADDGTVLLQTDDAYGFVRLRGYIAWADDSLDTPIDDVFFEMEPNTGLKVVALTTDNSFCFPESTSPVEIVTNPPQADPDDGYYYFCYVSNDWYGNLGVAGYDNSDELCPEKYSYAVGDLAALSLTPDTGSNGLVRTVEQHNFLLTNLQGSDDCTSAQPVDYLAPTELTIFVTGQIALAGQAAIDYASSGLSILEDTVMEATTNNFCTFDDTSSDDPLTAEIEIDYSCEIDTLTSGWGGHMVLTPDGVSGYEVCGSNTYYFPSAQTVDATVPVVFTLAGTADCLSTIYEFTVVFDVTGDPGNNPADEVTFTGGTELGGCTLDAGSDKKNATYRCAVSTTLGGTSVTIGIGHPTNTVSPTSYNFVSPATYADAEAINFEVQGAPITVSP